MEDETIIDILDDLVENCKDARYGFRSCAGQALDRGLARCFSQRAGAYASAAGPVRP